jgi:CDGSH-type Zn-finger protein
VDPTGASTQVIKDQIDKCPSGALSYYDNASGKQAEAETGQVEIEVVENGPLRVVGKMRISSGEGVEERERASFCRCGASRNKPYCDGTHKKIDFKG